MTNHSRLTLPRPDPSVSIRVPPDRCGLILHESGRRYYWEGEGLLSIKSFSRGGGLYNTGQGLHRVDESSYLILNDKQPYSITIEAERPVESFCIFFMPHFAEQVYYGLSSAPGRLLDEPEPPDNLRIRFFDKTYPHDELLSPALLSLKASHARGGQGAGRLEERLHELMGLLLRVHRGALQEALTLDAVRASTREELYRRLSRAKDFISACSDRPLTLKQIASVACLSPNHLLRSFRQAFRLTPHQFLTAARLEHARRMLADPSLSVTEVCFSVGFESPGSFSRLFRRHTGLSPSEYRRKR